MTVKGVNFNQGYEPDGTSLDLSGAGLMQIKDGGVDDAKLAAELNGCGHISMDLAAYVAATGTPALNVDTSAIHNMTIFIDNNHVNLTYLDYKIYLAKGVYNLIMLSRDWGNSGILKTYLGGVLVSTDDTYNGATAMNVRRVTTGITITESGLKTLRLQIDGKNASSSDYYGMITSITLTRTA